MKRYIGANQSSRDTYVMLVSIDNLNIGYIMMVSHGRGETWAHLTNDPDKAKELNRRGYRLIHDIDEFIIPHKYISSPYSQLHIVSPTDVDSLHSWVQENIGHTVHCYTLAKYLNIEYVKLSEAVELPNISEAEFESILVGYGK